MKTKICMAMLFSAFFTFNGFAAKYKVIKVEGSVSVTYNGRTTQLIRKGQEFDATATSSEFRFGSSGASISFGIVGSRNTQPQIAGCADPNCRNSFLMAGNVSGGTRRELDEFLADGKDLSDEIANNLHISSLQLVQNSMQINQVKMRDIQRVDAVKMNGTAVPNATRVKAPAAVKVRQ